MDKEQVKETVKKEAEQLKKNYEEAVADAVPFFKKHKKAVIVTGVVVVLAVILLIVIF